VSQLGYIAGILNEINIHTELLELMDWDESKVDDLFLLISQIINNKNTISLIHDVSYTLKQNGYSDIVVKFISEYLNNIVIEKEINYDC